MEFWNGEFDRPCEQENQRSNNEVKPQFTAANKKIANHNIVNDNLKKKSSIRASARKFRRPSSCISKTSIKPEQEDFQNATKKIKRQLQPRMQLAASSVSVLNDLLNHVMELFGQELTLMSKVRKFKTLTVKQLESVTKLCFPKLMQKRAVHYDCLAIKNERC